MPLPKVSAILPCGYGDRFIDTAIECFLSQDYQGDLELVIVENNERPVPYLADLADWFPERIKYVRCPRQSVGGLRNIGTQIATGEICCTWDEDDWYAPNRVSEQIKRLLESGKAVTGWDAVLYFDVTAGEAYKYIYSPDRKRPPYAIGTSQCYWKSWWEQHPFVTSGVEDRPFSDEALRAGQLDSCDADQLCVATIHSRNACNKRSIPLGHHKQWPSVQLDTLPKQFLETPLASESSKQ